MVPKLMIRYIFIITLFLSIISFSKANNWFISSESCSIPHNSYLRDVMPGEIIKISENKLKTIKGWRF